MDKEVKMIWGHCPNCGPDINSNVIGFHKRRWDDDESPVYAYSKYYLLECRGCERAYYRVASWFSEDPEEEDIAYWPSPSKRDKPDWVYRLSPSSGDLYSLLNDIYVALNNDLQVLAAIGVRTAFDLSSELLGVDSNYSFAKKLNELENSGKIGKEEKEILTTWIEAGSAAAHRGWRPSIDELQTMMDCLENFLYRNFVLGGTIDKLKSRVPPRKSKT